MARRIRQTVTINATPRAVYEALMDSRRHAKFTGGAARISRKVGGAFSVFDGYARGVNVALERNRRIVQTWRANDWPARHYSLVTFALTKASKGTRLTFTQTNIPSDQVESVRQGWKEFYWTPLKAMLETPARPKRARPSSRRPASVASAARPRGTPGTARR